MAFLAQLSWLILSTMAANENFVEHVRSYNKKKKITVLLYVQSICLFLLYKKFYNIPVCL